MNEWIIKIVSLNFPFLWNSEGQKLFFIRIIFIIITNIYENKTLTTKPKNLGRIVLGLI